MRIPKVTLFVFLIYIFGLVSLQAAEPVKIRVAVLKDVSQAQVSVSGSFDILDAKSKKILFRGRNLSLSKATGTGNVLKIGSMIFTQDGVVIIPRQKAAIVVNKRSYRGDIAFFRDASGKLLVVNTLDLEFYIKGVLYHEISHKWPIDAIKAQAVAVRTYAVYQKSVMASKNYDLTADTSAQVYGGYYAEKNKTNRAVDFTKSEVLVYQGKVFPAYFHATCGAKTEDAAQLWKVNILPLKGGQVCSFCKHSPHFFWEYAIGIKDIQRKLEAGCAFKGELKGIFIQEYTGSGRVKTLLLEDACGQKTIVSAKDFRSLVGVDDIRSTNFTVAIEGARVIFKGKGWGHGVGLCQWGAMGMARKGYDYKEILSFYYPGADLLKLT